MILEWQDILTIIGPILGVLAWTYVRIDKRFDKADEKFEKIEKSIQVLDSRVSRIEGHLFGPYLWQPTLIEKKKEE